MTVEMLTIEEFGRRLNISRSTAYGEYRHHESAGFRQQVPYA